MGLPTKFSSALLDSKEIKRFLRNRRTGDYFTGADWSPNPTLAMNYADVCGAVKASARLGGAADLVFRHQADGPDEYRIQLNS